MYFFSTLLGIERMTAESLSTRIKLLKMDKICRCFFFFYNKHVSNASVIFLKKLQLLTVHFTFDEPNVAKKQYGTMRKIQRSESSQVRAPLSI